MFHLTPPSGAPVSIRDIVKAVSARMFRSRDAVSFASDMAILAGVSNVFFFNSGRAAMCAALKVLMEIDDRDRKEVIIPAYTCYSVAASVAKSGLKIRLVDIDPMTMDYDYDSLVGQDMGNVLAIVPCNLFGIASDWNRLQDIKLVHNVFLIDDSAQALGSNVNGRPSGSLGDLGIYSLDRGKNLTTFSGGVLLTSDEKISDVLNRELEEYDSPGAVSELTVVAKLFVYSMLLKPGLYWLPSMLPFLGLGETVYDEEFRVGELSLFQECAGEVFLGSLESMNKARAANAKALIDGLSDCDKYRLPGADRDDMPIYLRLPVLAADREHRDRAIDAVRKCSVVASSMYPSTIDSIEGIGNRLAETGLNYPGAQEVVDCLFTLPTHPYVSARDIERIVGALRAL